MPDIPRHLIKKSWELYRHHAEGNDCEPSELEFVMGFAACLGLIMGSFDLGIPANTDPGELLMQLSDERDQYRAEIQVLEDEARKRTNRRNQ